MVWAATVAVMLVPLTWSVVRSLVRGDVGVDAIALVSMARRARARRVRWRERSSRSCSPAETRWRTRAAARARRELTQLVERAPRIAHRAARRTVVEVAVDEVAVGDVVVVRAGEVVPVDGLVVARRGGRRRVGADRRADAGRRTGGAEAVRSGTTNAGEAFELRAIRPGGGERLRRPRPARARGRGAAGAVRAPGRSLRDRLPAGDAVVAALAWALSGDPVRALAVFVVATPCPLILAAPIALISGVSRAARAGVIVKGAGVIERLGAVSHGAARQDGHAHARHRRGRARRVVRRRREPTSCSASPPRVDQLSAHALAEALVARRRAARLRAELPERGRGAARPGDRGDASTAAASRSAAPSWLLERGYDGDPLPGRRSLDDAARAGRAKVLVGVDGRLAGGDRHGRPAARRRTGACRVAARGRHPPRRDRHRRPRRGRATRSARRLGVDRVYAEQSPEEKLEVVRAMQRRSELSPVRDGRRRRQRRARARARRRRDRDGRRRRDRRVRDRRRRHRASIASTASPTRSASAAARSHIARQSVLFGMGLSGILMCFAAFGFIPPVLGALLQEGIDVAVILNALRALRG